MNSKQGKLKKIHTQTHHIQIIKRQKILRAERKSESSCTRYSIQITDDFSTETQEDRRQWDGIFKVLKEKKPVKNSILSNTTLQK